MNAQEKELKEIQDTHIDWTCPACKRAMKVIPGGFFGCQLCENDDFHRRHSTEGAKNCPICLYGSV